ncbi:MAG: ribonuclease P protein subunit [Candidatus Aenigmarchaeota archaeon]|nr:ribonuclease P protein subunit [Candidatus Aenigmarchaeota archaeon]
MRNTRNIAQHELIGLDCEIVESLNPSQRNVRGCVIDEGMNVIVVRTEKGDKKIEKKGTRIKFMVGRGKVTLDGDTIAVRPEDRIKKRSRRW